MERLKELMAVIFILLIIASIASKGYKALKKFESKKRNEQRYQICMQNYNDAFKCKSPLLKPIPFKKLKKPQN